MLSTQQTLMITGIAITVTVEVGFQSAHTDDSIS